MTAFQRIGIAVYTLEHLGTVLIINYAEDLTAVVTFSMFVLHIVTAVHFKIRSVTVYAIHFLIAGTALNTVSAIIVEHTFLKIILASFAETHFRVLVFGAHKFVIGNTNVHTALALLVSYASFSASYAYQHRKLTIVAKGIVISIAARYGSYSYKLIVFRTGGTAVI